MAGSTAVSRRVFDSNAFWDDVYAWMERRQYTADHIGVMVDGSHRSHLARVIKFRKVPSLMVVCILADVADLSIDKYVKSQFTR